MGVAAEPASDAWNALTGPLGLTGAALGRQVSTPAGAPRLAGMVEHAGPPEYPELLVRLDEPAPGLAHLFALPMGGQVYLTIRFYLYGDQASAAAARTQPVWQAWVNEHFAPAGVESSAA
jgi:hypothetical protein